jgi:hypothetical protein
VRIIRDREDARWLPSRFHFALFRLAAFVRMTFTRPRERRGIIVAIDREQSTIEHYTISIWFTATVACFFAFLMPLALAIVVATIAVQFPIFMVGRGKSANTVVLMSLATIAAAVLTTTTTWIRFVAWQFLGVLAMNAIAEIVMLTLRDAVHRMEARCGL